MNRPNKKDAPNYPWEFPDTYLRELEKYCDELEEDNYGLANEISKRADTENALINTISKLEKALDKACEAIEFVERSINCEKIVCSECKYCGAKNCIANDKNAWKEWLLKDE